MKVIYFAEEDNPIESDDPIFGTEGSFSVINVTENARVDCPFKRVKIGWDHGCPPLTSVICRGERVFLVYTSESEGGWEESVLARSVVAECEDGERATVLAWVEPYRLVQEEVLARNQEANRLREAQRQEYALLTEFLPMGLFKLYGVISCAGEIRGKRGTKKEVRAFRAELAAALLKSLED